MQTNQTSKHGFDTNWLENPSGSEMYAAPRDTLPKQIEVLVDRLFESFSVITQNVSPQEFKRRAYKSLNPAERSILDGTSQ